MKKLLPLILVLATLAAPVFAVEMASDNTARAIILKKDELKGKTVSVDVAMVTRVRLDAPKTEAIGAVLFTAHTWDTKNNSRGGSVLVAVPKAEADAFERRYGTAVDTGSGDRRRREVETKTLRAPLLVLPRGGTIILDPSGKVVEAVKAGKAEAVESAAEEGSKQADEKPGDRQAPPAPTPRRGK